MTPIPAFPPISNPMWIRAAQLIVELRKKGAQNPLIAAVLTNTYAESAIKPLIEGDDGSAYSIVQWHWNPRGQRILDNTGIDVRTETSIPKLVDAMWWELQTIYPKVLEQLQAASSGEEATGIFCKLYEGAGAADAISRRELESAYLIVWIAKNKTWIAQNGQ